MRFRVAWLVAALITGAGCRVHGFTAVNVHATPQTIATLKNAPVSAPLTSTCDGCVVDGYRIVGEPVMGTVELFGPAFTYTPLPNTVGNDSFSFVAISGGVESIPATVNMRIGIATPQEAALRSVLTSKLLVGPSTTIDPLCVEAGLCPLSNPIEYLDANRDTFDGVPVQVPGTLTPAGMDVWVRAASSACGRMMREQSPPVLFPNGVHDYDHLFQVLVRRAPAADDVTDLEALETQFSSDERKGAAACTAVLSSMEFLALN